MDTKMTLEVPLEFYQNVKRLAVLREQSMTDVLQEALALVEMYSSGLEESAAMRKEEAAYGAMHSQLFEKYAGQYVAVHKGKLVDYDADEMTLYRRIDERYPYDVVLMKKVEKLSEKVFHFRSPRLIREG